MEQNQPMLAKKVWSMVRVAYIMLRKGISKKKLLLDLNMMVKRGKVASSKAMQNLMSHHHHHHQKGASLDDDSSDQHDDEDEFSCTNSPTTNNHDHAFSLSPMFHKRHPYSNNNNKHHEEDPDLRAINAAVLKAMEMIQSETSSPSLPELGKSPMVRQLRVTDSPFPLSKADEDSHMVDEAAEKFINRFYNNLRRQNSNSSSFGSS